MYLVEMTTGDQKITIHEPGTSQVKLTAGQIKRETNKEASFDMTMLPNNPGYNQVMPLLSRIKVTRTDRNEVQFFGRVLTPSPKMETSGLVSASYTCADALDYLHDVYPPYQTLTGTGKVIINKLLDTFNNYPGLESYKHIKLGNVGGTASYSLQVGPEKDVYDTIHDFVTTIMGYEMQLRMVSDTELYLDVQATLGTTSSTVISLGRNLQSLSVDEDPTSIITRAIPLGATKQSTTNSTTASGTEAVQPRVSLADVGKPLYIDLPDLITKYGIQSGPVIFDDVTDANQLTNRLQTWAKSQRPVLRKFSVTALDLSKLGMEADDFDIYNYYRVVNPIMGIDEPLRVIGQTIDIINIASESLTIGDKYKSGTDYALDAARTAQQAEEQSKIYQAAVQTLNSKLSGYDKQISSLSQEVTAIKTQLDSGGASYYTGSIIDVSEWQQTIDWDKVVGAGLALAVIRVQHGASHEDLTYKTSIPAAVKAGANYGVYAYFAAISAADAESEASSFYSRATAAIGSGKAPRLWMIDVEENSVASGTIKDAVTAYLNKLNSLGVPDSKIVIYVSNALFGSIDTTRTQIWIPSYGINDGTVANATKPLHPYDLWQYTSKGVVPGITANTVDMSTDPSDRFKAAFLTK